MCIKKREQDPANPESRNLEENHLVSVFEVLNLTTKVTKPIAIHHMTVLSFESIAKARAILKLDTPADPQPISH